jgi:hypothetical protein
VDRRAFIGTLTGGLLAAPPAVEAQQTGKVWRIGVLLFSTPATDPNLPVFRDALRRLGWTEGGNLTLEGGVGADIVWMSCDRPLPVTRLKRPVHWKT